MTGTTWLELKLRTRLRTNRFAAKWARMDLRRSRWNCSACRVKTLAKIPEWPSKPPDYCRLVDKWARNRDGWTIPPKSKRIGWSARKGWDPMKNWWIRNRLYFQVAKQEAIAGDGCTWWPASRSRSCSIFYRPDASEEAASNPRKRRSRSAAGTSRDGSRTFSGLRRWPRRRRWRYESRPSTTTWRSMTSTEVKSICASKFCISNRTFLSTRRRCRRHRRCWNLTKFDRFTDVKI